MPFLLGYQIELLGRIPSKKNSTWTVMIKGRSIRLPSQKFKEWHKQASAQLLGKKCYNEISGLTIEFYAPDKRATDLTNKAESVMDLLVDNGIIPDDNWFEVPEITLRFCGVDKENPRAIVTIYGKEKI